MRDGHWQGHDLSAPEVRRLFDRAEMLKSDWYAARLEAKRQIDAATLEAHARYLEKFLKRASYADVAVTLDIDARAQRIANRARAAKSPAYIQTLRGTLGGEPALAPAIVQAVKRS